jgi:hypothetical protein
MMQINYWDCKYNDYNVFHNNEIAEYGCTHPIHPGICPYDNKYGDNTADCIILDFKLKED